MSDPVFRSLRQPVEVAPPDPATIRRRGEQRGRRTAIASTIGVAALVALVVAPIAALTSGNNNPATPAHTIAPTPSATTTPSGTPSVNGAWLAIIPDSFPLGDGLPMPGEASASMLRARTTPLSWCGTEAWSPDHPVAATNTGIATNADVVDPADGTDTRTLALYPDATAAKRVSTTIAQALDACPTSQSAGDAPQVADRLGDEDAWLLTLASTDRPVASIVTVKRVGNALLLQQDSFNGPEERTTDDALADIRAGQEQVVAAMCIFAADPCGSPPSHGQSVDPGVHVDEIPDSFPIDIAYQDPGSDGEVHAPSPDGQSVVLDPCGVEAFAAPAQDRLAFQVTGPEYADTRELRTYPTATDAVEQMGLLRAAVAGCPRDPSSDPGGAVVWSTYDVDTGYDSFAAAQTYAEGLGGGVWVFTRVGRSILALVEGGEFALETVQVRVPAVADRAKQIAPSMCLFTDAGC